MKVISKGKPISTNKSQSPHHPLLLQSTKTKREIVAKGMTLKKLQFTFHQIKVMCYKINPCWNFGEKTTREGVQKVHMIGNAELMYDN